MDTIDRHREPVVGVAALPDFDAERDRLVESVGPSFAAALRGREAYRADGSTAPGAVTDTAPTPAVLTAREHEVLAWIAQGLTNPEIAARLAVTTKTVMHHSTAIYRKLGVRGRAEATAFAYRAGLVS
jgi:DNA-binding NarL/FixJ family response regulator